MTKSLVPFRCSVCREIHKTNNMYHYLNTEKCIKIMNLRIACELNILTKEEIKERMMKLYSST